MVNDSRVIPARLYGVKADTGGHIEVLLLEQKEKDVWETLVKPGKKAKPGVKLIFGDGLLTGEVLETVEGGNRLIRFTYEGESIYPVLEQIGNMPLPPYITSQARGQRALPDCLFPRAGLGRRADRRAALHQRTAGQDPRKGGQRCDSDAARRPWHLPSG